ncbi:hypothetical protein EPO15_03130 [bacterium]|nr:MAG: hypothetical protein EPO15_03130 [bacterium]
MALFTIFAAAAGGVLFTEIVGYFLHILLHSEKVAWLSRDHMIHHLKVYSVEAGLRQPGPYKDSTHGRTALAGVGLEWLLPTALVLVGMLAVFRVLHIPGAAQAVFSVAALTWGKFMFGSMHDAMHVEGFWLSNVPLLGTWFRHIRRLHDIHHLEFTDDGRMLTNFGISFFGFDRLFGTYLPKAHAFNTPGYRAALERYKSVIA